MSHSVHGESFTATQRAQQELYEQRDRVLRFFNEYGMGEYPNSNPTCSTFDPDGARIAVGHNKGFFIMDSGSFENVRAIKFPRDIALIELVSSEALVAVVWSQSRQPGELRRQLDIFDLALGIAIHRTYNSAIFAVKMIAGRVVVIFQTGFLVYELDSGILSSIRAQISILSTADADAIYAFSSQRGYIAYPSPAMGFMRIEYGQQVRRAFSTPPSKTNGNISTYDPISLEIAGGFVVKGTVDSMAMDTAGTKLATVTDNGRFIRVYSVPQGVKLWRVDRGGASARIWSINFSLSSTMLAVASDSVVEVYRVDVRAPLSDRLQGSLCKLLPKGVRPRREFARVKLGVIGEQSVVKISSTDPSRIMVICSDGKVYRFRIDLQNGGEPELVGWSWLLL